LKISPGPGPPAGLLANLIIGVFLLPTLYVWMASDNDILPAAESDEEY
jgi:cobalt-zinc-cadmium resistance protein CzcA